MTTQVLCPHCNQPTDIWLDGAANIFDCQNCGQAFSYEIQPPAPPILPTIPTMPQHLSVTHNVTPSGFWRVFRYVFYTCASLAILAVAGIIGLMMLGSIGSAFERTAKTERLVPDPAPPAAPRFAPLTDQQKALAQNLLRTLESRYDEIKEITYWGDNPAGTGISAYVGRHDRGGTFLRIYLQYSGDDWIFFDNVTIKADDEKFEIPVQLGQVKRDNSAGTVWEWLDVDADLHLDAVIAIAKARRVLIRFSGDEYYHDYVVPFRERQKLANMLLVYCALGGK